MIVESIIAGQLDKARDLVRERMQVIFARKLVECKKMVGAKFYKLFEAGRFKIVPVRIRKGKVQRRKKVSNIKGYTFRKKAGSKAPSFVRMSVKERRDRRLGQRFGKFKRKAKRTIIKQHRMRSMRKRKALGL